MQRFRAALAPLARGQASQMSRRFFSAKPKHQDSSVLGRYATALFGASGSKLDAVWDDMSNLRSCLEASDFDLMVKSPGIQAKEKVACFEAIAKKGGFQDVSTNLLKLMVENRRIHELDKFIDVFEMFYRVEKGQVVCHVTSAKELTGDQKSQVADALKTRAKGAQTIVSYATNPAMMGGLAVKMGDQVLDFSVQSKLERLTNTLLEPVG